MVQQQADGLIDYTVSICQCMVFVLGGESGGRVRGVELVIIEEKWVILFLGAYGCDTIKV